MHDPTFRDLTRREMTLLEMNLQWMGCQGGAFATFALKGLQFLLWWEVPWVALLALPLTLPGRFLPLRDTPLLVMMLFVFWPLRLLLQWLETRALGQPLRQIWRQPLLLPLLAILLSLAISLSVAADLRFGWIMAAYLLLGIAACMALIHWPPTQKRPGLVAIFIMLVALLLSIFGPPLLIETLRSPRAVLFFAALLPFVQGWDETLNPNILAGGLLPAIPLALALAIAPWGKGWWRQALGLVRSLLLLALTWWLVQVLTLTDSRGALLAAAVALLLVPVLRWPALRWPALVLVIVALVWLFFNDPIRQLNAIMVNGMANDYNSRMEIWVRSWQAFRSHLLTGIGIGGFVPLVVEQMAPIQKMLTPQVTHAHNLFLQVGVDLGLLGLVAYAACVVEVWRGATRAWRADNGVQRALAGGVLAALLAINIHGLLDAPLWNSKLAFLPWLIFALGILVWQGSQQAALLSPQVDEDMNESYE